MQGGSGTYKNAVNTTNGPVAAIEKTHYEKLEKLEGGAHGRTYKAKVVETGVIVALKSISHRGERYLEEGLCQTTVREITILKSLSHPNIVRVLGVESRSETLFVIFEWCDMDLKRYMHMLPGTLRPQLIQELMYQLINGVTYCHTRFTIHRDLKPQNIHVDRGAEAEVVRDCPNLHPSCRRLRT